MKYKIRKIASVCLGLKYKFQHRHINCNWRETLVEKGVVIDCREGGSITAGKMTIEQNVYLASSGSLKIGNKVFFNRNTIVVCRDDIAIGDNCIFGPNVCIYDHDHNFDSDGIKEGYKTKPISIGNNCWIGAGSIILKGTVIEDNCVIGAGTVVNGIIPSGSIVKNNRECAIIPINR